MKLCQLLLNLTLLAVLSSCARDNSSMSANFSGGSGIIGGEDVEPGSRVSRSVVALYGRGFGICSGTIISSNAILTAAHCVPTTPGIKLSVVFATSVRAATAAKMRPVVKMYTAPNWGVPKSPKNWGDLAIMKFAGGLPPGYIPAPFLPFPKLIASHTTILLSGFGVNDGLGQTGDGILRNTLALITNPQFSETEVLVDQRDGRGSCAGDSGGPAFIRYGGNVYIWGVVSRGDRNCVKNGIYTNALVYRKWIKEILMAP